MGGFTQPPLKIRQDWCIHHQQFCVNTLANQLMIGSWNPSIYVGFFSHHPKRWLALGFLVAINSTTLKWGKSSPQNSWDFTEVFRSTACECGDASLKKRWDLCVSFGLLMGLWVFFFCILAQTWKIYWNLEFYSTTCFGDFGRTCGSFLSYPSRWVSFFKVPTCLKQQRSSWGCCGKKCELWVLYGFLYVKQQHHLAWAKFWGKLADPKFDLEAEQNTRRQRHGIHHQRWRNHQALIRSVTQHFVVKKKQVPSRHGMAWCNMCFWD